MDEELVELGTEEYFEVMPEDSFEDISDIDDLEQSVDTEEEMHFVQVEDAYELDIETTESTGWVGGDSTQHYSLNGRDDYNQHPIKAITGLRAELDEIERIKTVYSDKANIANCYEWADASYDTYGYFVSLVPNTATIKICDGSEIFGVSVDTAGFVGGQDDSAPMDNSRGLIATSGLVDVRCELGIEVGDCVVSNASGYATKSSSDYGYRVLARENKNGVEYAIIMLGVQADVTNVLGLDLNTLAKRVGVNEDNIVSAINVANQAYNQSTKATEVSEEAVKNALDALLKSNEAEDSVEEIGKVLESTNHVATQAKAIAESAATSAESMRNEAVAEANKALAETSELRKEFDALADEMGTDLENAALELEATKESIESTKNELQGDIDDAVKDLEELEKDLEPLATWPEGATGDAIKGIAGFVAQADEDSATLASMVAWKGDAGDSLAGFVQEATEENATVKSIASYKRKDANGDVIEPGGAAGLTAQVDANQSELNAVASYEKDGAKGLAGLRAQVDANKSELSVVASYEKGDATGLAGLVAQVDANKSELSTVAAYNKNGKTGLAGLAAYVDENSASTSTLAKYSNDDSGNSGIAGLVADVDDNTSTLSVVAKHSFTKDDGTVVTGLAGLQAQVNDNTSEVSLVTNRVAGKYVVVDSWSTTGKNTSTVYYAKDTKLYWYYSGGWKSTTDAYVAGLPASTAGIQVVADEHSSKINSLAAFEDDTTKSLARIEQKADANGAYIQSTVANMDKYSVGPISQSYGFTLEQAKSVLEIGMIYVPTATHTEEAPSNRTFTQQYYYTWDGEKWVTSDSVAVTFSNSYVAGGSIIYWYIPGSNNVDKDEITYNSHTLYKWEAYVDQNDITQHHWVAVATLEGNSSSRAVSQIRQDANSIAFEVTNPQGSFAGMKATLDETKSDVSSLSAWQNGESTNEAIIRQVTNDDGASIVIATLQKDVDGNISEMASMTLMANNGGNALIIDADHVDVDGVFSAIEGNIQTLTADYINAMDIKADSLVINDKNGKTLFSASASQNSVEIGSWKIDDEGLYRGIGESWTAFLCPNGKKTTLPVTSGEKWWTFQVGNYFGVTADGYLYCTEAHISGEINAGSGSINGNLTLGANGGLYFKENDTDALDYFRHTEFKRNQFVMERGQGNKFVLQETDGQPLGLSLDIVIGANNEYAHRAMLKMTNEDAGEIEGGWTFTFGDKSITLQELVNGITHLIESGQI